ncbi:hypothetical protein BCON_0146g00080 [Botryotinia convoluta]|uniref:Uncharacterized protein n=1 Tax=Botryotinia convoluta TaxID=54673 RepID=A0A4Z1I5G4_9HELO|nr:hypothetical protein BCON_0146g00080 [Botryotinia convoluta]
MALYEDLGVELVRLGNEERGRWREVGIIIGPSSNTEITTSGLKYRIKRYSLRAILIATLSPMQIKSSRKEKVQTSELGL